MKVTRNIEQAEQEAIHALEAAAVAIESIAYAACERGDLFAVYRAVGRAKALRTMARDIGRGFF